MPTDCIKERQFHLGEIVLEIVNLDNEFGHLFIADIEFDQKSA